MTGRKRKADDDLDFERSSTNDGSSGSFDENMSLSPMSSPAVATRVLARPSKKVRGNDISGRPLALPRLLETLDAQSLRNVLQKICESRPEIGREVVASAPRPSAASALDVLAQYQDKLRESFPFGGNGGSDYAYNRVKDALSALLDALTDFTPHYLPPNETQVTTSLAFLDGATKVIHELPDWESSSHKHHKDNAYDEISKAWALVIIEASKKGGGFQLHNGEWDQKVAKHNEQSGGRMQAVVNALGSNLGWMGAGPSTETRDPGSIRNQLFSGTYGSNFPVRVGPW
jgi:protein Cut8